MIKPFKKFREQADLLLQRGMKSATGMSEVELKRIILERLMYVNYYRLSAYWMPYLQADAKGSLRFRSGTCWEDVWNMYMFDRKLRNLLFDAISRIEIALRTQLAYRWSEHSHHPQPHTQDKCMRSFPDTTEKAQKEKDKKMQQRDKTLKSIEDNFKLNRVTYAEWDIDIKRAKSTDDLPIWSYVEFATMGNLDILLQVCLKPDVVKRISSSMGVKKADFFVSGISLLKNVRNACAHQSRTWNRTWTIRGNDAILRKVDDDFRQVADVTKTAAALTFCYIVLKTIAPHSKWKERLMELMESPQIPISHVYKKMGFNNERWYEHPLWN